MKGIVGLFSRVFFSTVGGSSREGILEISARTGPEFLESLRGRGEKSGLAEPWFGLQIGWRVWRGGACRGPGGSETGSSKVE